MHGDHRIPICALRQRQGRPPRRGREPADGRGPVRRRRRRCRARRTCCFLRSPHPHARIVAHRHGRRARRCPAWSPSSPATTWSRAGVKPLPLSADFKRADGSPTASRRRGTRSPSRRVRFVGEAVAAVVAETRDAGARRGRGDRRATTSRCRRSSTSRDAIAPGAPLVWPEATGNIACRDAPRRRRGDGGGVRAARRTSSRSTSSTSALAPCPIEPRAMLAELRRRDRPHHAAREQPDADRAARRAVRRACSASRNEKVRVLVGDVGGGFGMKTGALPRGRRRSRTARAQLEAAGQVVRRAHRGVPGGDARPRRHAARPSSRSTRDGRVLALRVRLARQRRRLRDAGRRRDPAADRAVGVDQHLRHRHRSTSASRRC